ncbi:tRNA dimethylallyltransferase [Candidatus Saccharibacteria bacterium]|nr:tRNA dimethylallyltransferase [Candidatus Saccharibacteria bacterium]
MRDVSPLVVIVGPTASGKTALAIELAERYDGEIICADSRTVYKGLDIGTAKPTPEERRQVPHHLLDVAGLDEPFTVADFKQSAEKAIEDISRRGKLAIMVGGSGLYVDAVIYDYQFSDGSRRDEVNARHAHRDSDHSKSGLRHNTLLLGLSVDTDRLRERIRARVESMLREGLVEEVKWAIAQHPGAKALDATGYKAVRAYLSGDLSVDEAADLFVQNDYQLSRRQMTWFRRNKSIHWLNHPSKADDFVTTFLNKKQ